MQKPRLLLTLGIFVPEFIASLSCDLAPWKKCDNFKALDASDPGPSMDGVHFCDAREQATTVVALVHPSTLLSHRLSNEGGLNLPCLVE